MQSARLSARSTRRPPSTSSRRTSISRKSARLNSEYSSPYSSSCGSSTFSSSSRHTSSSVAFSISSQACLMHQGPCSPSSSSSSSACSPTCDLKKRRQKVNDCEAKLRRHESPEVQVRRQQIHLSPIQMKFLRDKAHRIALHVLEKNTRDPHDPTHSNQTCKESNHQRSTSTANTMMSSLRDHDDLMRFTGLEANNLITSEHILRHNDHPTSKQQQPPAAHSDRDTTWSKMQRKHNAKAYIQKSKTSKRRLDKVMLKGTFAGKEADVVEGFFSDHTSTFKREMLLHHREHFVDARVFQIRYKSAANKDAFSFCGLKSVQCRASGVKYANCIYQMTFVDYSATYIDPTTKSRTLIKVLLAIDPSRIPTNGREIMDHQEAVVYLFRCDGQKGEIDVTLQSFLGNRINMQTPMVLTKKTIWIWWRAIGTILAAAQYRRMKVVEKSEWVPDEKRSHCIACDKRFTAFRHRHHCRACGEIMCTNCTMKCPDLSVRLKGSLSDKFCILCVQKPEEAIARRSSAKTAMSSRTTDNLERMCNSLININELLGIESDSSDSEFSIAPISEVVDHPEVDDQSESELPAIREVELYREQQLEEHNLLEEEAIEELDTAQMFRSTRCRRGSNTPFDSRKRGSNSRTPETSFDMKSLPPRERQRLLNLQKAHENLRAAELQTQRNLDISVRR